LDDKDRDFDFLGPSWTHVHNSRVNLWQSVENDWVVPSLSKGQLLVGTGERLIAALDVEEASGTAAQLQIESIRRAVDVDAERARGGKAGVLLTDRRRQVKPAPDVEGRAAGALSAP
jgi:hypothetical protein